MDGKGLFLEFYCGGNVGNAGVRQKIVMGEGKFSHHGWVDQSWILESGGGVVGWNSDADSAKRRDGRIRRILGEGKRRAATGLPQARE